MKSVFDIELMKPKQLEDLLTIVTQFPDSSYSLSNTTLKSMCYAVQNKIVNKIPVSSYRSGL